jgi:tRNA nucleotidyltransferase (CCA-adding enzyme)
MLEVALKLLKEITSHSYQAYIVGGFVRDYLLGIESNDIDITTNATPKQIKEMFSDSCLPNEDYGSVTVIMKGVRFEITTFRREIEYVNNRKPLEIQYIDDLYEDLLRRDFVINTLCMDEDGKVLDYLGGQEDLKKHVIRTIGDARKKFTEDSLRILRAVRFATLFNFQLDKDIIEAIQDTKYLLYHLSYYRKKEELDKIFASSNSKYGINLIKELGLSDVLELNNTSKVVSTTYPIGIWAQLNCLDKYDFNKTEKDTIIKINELLDKEIFDNNNLYKYGLYISTIVGEIKGIDTKLITEAYNSLYIHNKTEIKIDPKEICEMLNSKPGKYLKDILSDIENKIVNKELINDNDALRVYIKNSYCNFKQNDIK